MIPQLQGQRTPGAIASARASGDGATGVPTVPSPVADWGRAASGDGAMGVPTVPSPVADRGRVGRAWAGRRGQWRVWREGWRAEHGERKKDTQENSKGAQALWGKGIAGARHLWVGGRNGLLKPDFIHS